MRLSDALESITNADPRLGVIFRAFSKHLRKNPPPDEDIITALDWVDTTVRMVRGTEPIPVTQLTEGHASDCPIFVDEPCTCQLVNGAFDDESLPDFVREVHAAL